MQGLRLQKQETRKLKSFFKLINSCSSDKMVCSLKTSHQIFDKFQSLTQLVAIADNKYFEGKDLHPIRQS